MMWLASMFSIRDSPGHRPVPFVDLSQLSGVLCNNCRHASLRNTAGGGSHSLGTGNHKSCHIVVLDPTDYLPCFSSNGIIPSHTCANMLAST
jgi:hypothetical protein